MFSISNSLCFDFFRNLLFNAKVQIDMDCRLCICILNYFISFSLLHLWFTVIFVFSLTRISGFFFIVVFSFVWVSFYWLLFIYVFVIFATVILFTVIILTIIVMVMVMTFVWMIVGFSVWNNSISWNGFLLKACMNKK